MAKKIKPVYHVRVDTGNLPSAKAKLLLKEVGKHVGKALKNSHIITTTYNVSIERIYHA